jgi:putative hemolysin
MLHSPDELRLVIQHVQLDPGARRLIDRVFDYTHRVARHVMTLRRDVVTLEMGRPFDDNLRIAVANQYTRYPLIDPANDRVVGYVHLKDIVAALASGRRPERMRDLVREPIYASEDTRLEWLRREFQRRRVHIAIILGSGHAFTGIVTLEDLVEEIVGEMVEQGARALAGAASPSGPAEVDGRLNLDDFAEVTGILLPPGPYDTAAGFLMAGLGRLPEKGDAVVCDDRVLTVAAMEGRRIARIKVRAVAE